ncbi:U3 small nucleolar RNA-associated protein 10 [Mycena chlorophos]|uniref:U3 small nucleolar RNA-associated protein 10 n=1 Tax=Mycena chlorophos TaxID=658473 RepID=A0A8H6TLH5_MYCCL|nr:U3 small nucleolar RNA-associated protein 10 [Mycena chlorophos]
MASSLAAQLAQGASLNTNALVDRSRRKATESYLFTGREADQHDLDTIHALGHNAFRQLCTLDAKLDEYEAPLFSDSARATDRTMLTLEEGVELDRAIDALLPLLGPYLTEGLTGRALEWLVRRFRINEFNVDAVLALFLPYHESPHFAKMLSILHLKPNSTWSLLIPFKSAAQPVPRPPLVTALLKPENSDARRFIVSLLPNAIKGNYVHHTLLAFNAATLHDYIVRAKSLDEGTLAHLLPALLEPLQNRTEAVGKDAILGSYILLSALSNACSLQPQALKTIIHIMSTCARRVDTKQFVNAVLSVCEAQDELDALNESTCKIILKLSNIKEELRAAEKWVGIQKLYNPLVAVACTDETTHSFLDAVIGSPTVPPSTIKRLTSILLVPEPSLPARRLLSHIAQLHPDVLQSVADSHGDEDEQLDSLVASLSAAQASTLLQSEQGSVVGSLSADERVRAAAVKELLQSDDPELSSAFVARVQDTSVAVLKALYADESDDSPTLRAVLADPRGYLENLVSALQSKPKRQALQLQMAFLSRVVSKGDVIDMEEVFHRVLFPFLLFSKTRQHSAEVVWAAVADVQYELLSGCWLAKKQAEEEAPEENKMEKINEAVVAKLAENIMASNQFSAHLNAFVRKLQDSDPHVRVLAFLVVRALLVRLEGRHQIDAANQALEALNVQQLPEVDDSKLAGQTLDEFLSDANLHRMVVHKATSKSTTDWLQLSVIALIATIPRPADVVLDWFTDDSNSISAPYIMLQRAVYKTANSTSQAPHVTVGLLSTLFAHLKDDALALLTGICVTHLRPNSDNAICVVALRHALAFLEAHKAEADGVDFQTILPALVICLQNDVKEIRAAALDCIVALNELAEAKFSTVYAFDAIYGSESEAQLQYLAQTDLKLYLAALVDHKDHIALDASFARSFHTQHLSRANGDKKKHIEYKQRILCYLLSHVNVLALLPMRIALLECLRDVSDSAKSDVLMHALVSLGEGGVAIPAGSLFEEFAGLVVSSIDASAAENLNSGKSTMWDVFVSVLSRHLKPDGSSSACRVALLRNLEQGLVASLSIDRKVEVCTLLLDAGTNDTEMYIPAKKVLSVAFRDIALVTRLLSLSKPNATTSPRATKRPKLSETADDTLPRLSLLAEVLASIPLPGSIDLVSRLLDTLHNVVQASTQSDIDISYIEQSLMSAVEHSAEKITDTTNLSPSTIHLDILVELIRVADNPQTFNQALLLMATLARLAPDSVLRNVMPVFTFMGSNVFHRDDSYSFKVVQKTVDSIVPVMVSSLKHFFGHLVDVLGPVDFLAPLCMLLAEKSANRIVRQTPEDVQSLLALPVSVLHRYPSAVQTFILTEILREAQRLVVRALDPENLEPCVLDSAPDDEQQQPTAASFRRRAQALVVFVGHAMKMMAASSSSSEVAVPQDGTPSDLVSLLIALATTDGVEEINQAARTSLTKALGCMAVVDFVHAVLSILRSQDAGVQSGVLALLAERLDDVAKGTRAKISSKISEVVEELRKLLLLSHAEGPLAIASFKALRSIALTMSAGAGEEGALTAVVPTILSAIKSQSMVNVALSALAPLSVKLGPRLIPFFRDIVAQCVSLLREDSATEGTLEVLHGLLTSIPKFWSPAELVQVSRLYIDKHTTPLAGLMKAIAKRVQTAVLLSALAELWPSVLAAPETTRVVGYFDLLKRCLRSGARPAVQENVRALFKIFQESFDLDAVAIPHSDAEKQTIAAFIDLVVKLNEASFRPLFRKLYDWAFADDASTRRQITFCDVYLGLLEYFKGLMNPYMTFLVPSFVAALGRYANNSMADSMLWRCIVEIFAKSLVADDGAFWRDDKLRLVAPALIQQVPVCIRLGTDKELISECLVALADNATDDALLKAMNLDLLMQTRAEDPKLRIFALSCATALWTAHGGKFLPFVSETTTFIVECSEDEHDMVVRESLRLKNAVESVAGKIAGL